jgi:tetratricopeptide (TPR) repeat protein
MRWIISGLTLFLAVFGATAEDQPFRTFTSADGQVIEARIDDFSAGRNMLRIERSNGTKAWVSPGAFDAMDHSYIKEWIAGYIFCANATFRVSAQKKETSLKGADYVHYEISLQNQSGRRFEDVLVDYRIYIDEQGYFNRKDSKRCVGGSIDFGAIRSRDQLTRSTESERLFEIYATIIESPTDFSKRKSRQDKVRGALFRIYGPTVDGKRAMREYAIPSGFGKETGWQETVSRGLTPGNKSRSLYDMGVGYQTDNTSDGFPKDLPMSLECFLESYEFEPKNRGFAACEIGKIQELDYYMGTGSVGTMTEWFEKAIEAGNNKGYVELIHFHLARLSSAENDAKEALKYARVLEAKEPQNPRFLFWVAKAYAQAGDFNKAVAVQEKVIARYKDVGGLNERTLKELTQCLENYKGGKKPYTE